MYKLNMNAPTHTNDTQRPENKMSLNPRVKAFHSQAPPPDVPVPTRTRQLRAPREARHPQDQGR